MIVLYVHDLDSYLDPKGLCNVLLKILDPQVLWIDAPRPEGVVDLSGNLKGQSQLFFVFDHVRARNRKAPA
ncbi:hypothetical protein D3C80_1894880 [compost metagenome]